MSELYMQIEWPDKRVDQVHSPSSIIKDFFKNGESLPLPVFENKVVEALHQASNKFRAKFGFESISALSEIERIRFMVSTMGESNKSVKIVKI